MCAAIENPAKCEVREVIRFLWAKKLSAAGIHRELCAVYRPNIMSEGVVRQWVHFFKDGRTNIPDESRSGRPSVVSADLIKEIDEKFVCSVISQSPNFQNTFQTFLGQFCMRR
ncbi:hypothetical protein AVEN_231700-1 [Araneus ventricosus]|uniref:Mos1 transposase HTH domain-containing protein n=1 Tax=Araneus ventricosus TaxID=182803 RepID=A0A4Y2PYJ2_ARAVE|nr:hypothetical protein AVEN_231700-1 [Araneus ventricosus]